MLPGSYVSGVLWYQSPPAIPGSPVPRVLCSSVSLTKGPGVLKVSSSSSAHYGNKRMFQALPPPRRTRVPAAYVHGSLQSVFTLPVFFTVLVQEWKQTLQFSSLIFQGNNVPTPPGSCVVAPSGDGENGSQGPRVLRANLFKGLGSPVPKFLFLYSLRVQKATLSNC